MVDILQRDHSTFSKDLSALREIEEESNQLRRTLEAVDVQMKVNSIGKKEAYLKVKAATSKNHDPFPSDEELAAFKEKQAKEFQEEFSKRLSQNGKPVDLDLLENIKRETVAEAMGRFGPPRNDREAMFLNDWIGDTIMHRYRATIAARENGPSNKKKETATSTNDSFWDDEDEIFDSEDEEMDAEIKSIFGELFEDLGIDEEEFNLDDPFRPKTAVKSGSSDFKSMYRQIVRLLHPDRGQEMNETEKELWSQAQAAYRSHDEASLRAILLRIEGGGKIDVSQLQSIGAIRELTTRLHFEYDEINYIKSQVKRESVYRFWASRNRPVNRKKLETKIGSELKNSIRYRKHELSGLLSEMKWMEREYSNTRSASRRK